MATNPAIKKALLKKLGVTDSRLSQLVKKRKAELPMSTELAVYTLAYEHRIDISKHLNSDETAEVRGLISDLRANGARTAPAGGTATPSRSQRVAARKPVEVTIAGFKVGAIPALSATHAKDAKFMSERVYPILYIFENSARDLIDRVLTAAYGPDWWEIAAPKKVRETAQKHVEAEKEDPWHGKRGRRELDYVFLADLWAIIKYHWKHFAAFFPDQAWVQTLFTHDMNVSRRVLAHMNPLDPNDVKNIDAAFVKWIRQLQANDAQIRQ